MPGYFASTAALSAGRRAAADRRPKKTLTRPENAANVRSMEERFYREQELARRPDFLSASTYNLAHTLLARAGKCLFVPIRNMQYMAVLDAEEFIFVDSQNRAWVELAWQHFRPQARSALDERVPFEVVHYLPQAAETMKRLPAEFHQALLSLAERQKPDAPAHVLALRPRQHGGN
jgi:hypothetical protein